MTAQDHPGMSDEQLLLTAANLIRRKHADPHGYLVGDVWAAVCGNEGWPADLCRLVDSLAAMVDDLLTKTTDVDAYLEQFATNVRFTALTQDLGEAADHTPPGQAGSTLGETR
jgi:hypothetical protein